MLNTAGKKYDKMKHLQRLSEFKGGGKILYQEEDYFISDEFVQRTSHAMNIDTYMRNKLCAV